MKGILGQKACLGYDAKDLSLKLEGLRLGVCGMGLIRSLSPRTHGPL